MNLPNKLTLLRILMIPFCLLLLYLRWDVPATILFILACLTDFFDGYIARKQGIVTNFGKFADPVADKILVVSLMVLLLQQGRFPWWALCIVIIRELAVDGLRLVAVEQGIVIPAGKLGKFKTNFQMLGVAAAMLNAPSWITITLAVILSALTVISGLQYFYEGRGLLNPHDKKAP